MRGIFGAVGADVMLMPHFGINGEYAFRFAQHNYLPILGVKYHPAFFAPFPLRCCPQLNGERLQRAAWLLTKRVVQICPRSIGGDERQQVPTEL
ncbi:MAG: hypothetical protein DMG30_14325 [Acidobacteria bacterium]|nr:MAG: hypothetical protein DMG30_14325 [Acidobacteriota bacterium]